MFDILSLQQPIFSKDLKNCLLTKYDTFVDEFFYEWILFVYLGEYETTIAYSRILKNIKKDVYSLEFSNISCSDKQIICKNFENMLQDESNHMLMLEQLLVNRFPESRIKQGLQSLNEYTEDCFRQMSLSKLLTRYYVGECYLWTGFYLLYKQITNLETKKLLHQLLIDESHHNNNIYKLFKKIQKNLDFDSNYFIEYTKKFKQFGQPFVEHNFKLFDQSIKKNQWWRKKLYDHPWHRDFNKRFLKKCYRIYTLKNTDTDFDTFFKLVNRDDMNWINKNN